jgi:hypothetical protein
MRRVKYAAGSNGDRWFLIMRAAARCFGVRQLAAALLQASLLAGIW